MVTVMSDEEAATWHQEVRDFIEDVIAGKYGRWAVNIISSFMHGFKDMKGDLDRYTEMEKQLIEANKQLYKDVLASYEKDN